MSTQDQRTDRAWSIATVRQAQPTVRVKDDAEGWPYVPGRHGRVESGADAATLWVYTPKPRRFRTLLALPGVTPYQTGDREARFRIAAPYQEHLPAILATIGARVIRSYTPEQKEAAKSRLLRLRQRRAAGTAA